MDREKFYEAKPLVARLESLIWQRDVIESAKIDSPNAEFTLKLGVRHGKTILETNTEVTTMMGLICDGLQKEIDVLVKKIKEI